MPLYIYIVCPQSLSSPKLGLLSSLKLTSHTSHSARWDFPLKGTHVAYVSAVVCHQSWTCNSYFPTRHNSAKRDWWCTRGQCFLSPQSKFCSFHPILQVHKKSVRPIPPVLLSWAPVWIICSESWAHLPQLTCFTDLFSLQGLMQEQWWPCPWQVCWYST